MIALILVLFAATWLAYGVISHIGMVLHYDVTEAYVWGQQFQLGYNQHPPFWAWIAGLWFLVFPNREWAFLLLAVVNSAVGLWGAWALIGRFAHGATQQAAWLLLLCTPFYTFSCFKYNANSIFLSIWPWTLFFLLVTLDSRRLRHSIWFGVMIGIALLSKYYAVILVITCVSASLIRHDARSYWRSARPWTSAAVATAVVSPHIGWLIANHAPPLHYALSTGGLSVSSRVVQSVLVLGAVAGLQLAIPLLISAAGGREAAAPERRDVHLLAVLVAMPLALTILAGLWLGVRVSAAMLIGTFPLAPLLAIRLMPVAEPRRIGTWALRAAIAPAVVGLLSSPITNRWSHRPKDTSWQLPLHEASEQTAELWHRATDRPIVTVGGTAAYSNAATFYDDDRPAGFLLLEPSLAPWISPERLRTGGLLVICLREDGPLDDVWCRGNAERLATPKTTISELTLTHIVHGKNRGTATLVVYITPPEP